MSSSPTERTSPTPADMSRRRGSVTQATLSTLFQRSNSVSAQGGASAPQGSGPNSEHRRRLSLTTGVGVGLSSTSPTQGFLRRASLSTNASEAIDENAVEEDEYPARNPFQRRMSFSSGGARGQRGIPPSPGAYGTQDPAAPETNSPPTLRRASVAGMSSGGRPAHQNRPSLHAKTGMLNPFSNMFSPTRLESGFNWSEQLKSRAESLTMASRPNWAGASSSPPRGVAPAAHERAKSMAEMPAPPAQASSMRSPPPKEAPRKPDAFQERILKGDFYMD